MNNKIYKIDHSSSGSITLKIDLDVVNTEYLTLFLDYWDFIYDEDDIFNESVKCIAAECFIESISNNIYNVDTLVRIFETKEGFPPLDGRSGITLINFNHYEFNKEDFSVIEVEN